MTPIIKNDTFFKSSLIEPELLCNAHKHNIMSYNNIYNIYYTICL